MTFSVSSFLYDSAAAIVALAIIAILFVTIYTVVKKKWPKKLNDCYDRLIMCFSYIAAALVIMVIGAGMGFWS